MSDEKKKPAAPRVSIEIDVIQIMKAVMANDLLLRQAIEAHEAREGKKRD